MEQKEKETLSIPAYPNTKQLIDKHAGEMFEALGSRSYIEVAYLFGLDKYLKSEGSMKSAAVRAYNQVMDNPERYGIQPDTVDIVSKAVKDRSRKPSADVIDIEKTDISVLISQSRDKAIKLIQRKLAYLDEDPKALQAEKMRDLGWVFGVLFDKGQIMAGAATEHIALMSNIPDHLDPEEALKAIMKIREELELRK